MKVHQANTPHNQCYNTKRKNGVKQEVMRPEPIGVYLSQPLGKHTPHMPYLTSTTQQLLQTQAEEGRRLRYPFTATPVLG